MKVTKIDIQRKTIDVESHKNIYKEAVRERISAILKDGENPPFDRVTWKERIYKIIKVFVPGKQEIEYFAVEGENEEIFNKFIEISTDQLYAIRSEAIAIGEYRERSTWKNLNFLSRLKFLIFRDYLK